MFVERGEVNAHPVDLGVFLLHHDRW
jgi:hypothetical protein